MAGIDRDRATARPAGNARIRAGRRADQFVDADPVALQREFAVAEPGHVEQVLDVAIQPLAFYAHRLEQAAPVGASIASPYTAQAAGGADDRGSGVRRSCDTDDSNAARRRSDSSWPRARTASPPPGARAAAPCARSRTMAWARLVSCGGRCGWFSPKRRQTTPNRALADQQRQAPPGDALQGIGAAARRLRVGQAPIGGGARGQVEPECPSVRSPLSVRLRAISSCESTTTSASSAASTRTSRGSTTYVRPRAAPRPRRRD